MKSMLFVSVMFILAPLTVHAGELVFGPESIEGGLQATIETRTFEVLSPKGVYWLHVSNGEGGKSLSKNIAITLNGAVVARGYDVRGASLGFTKDVYLQPINTLQVRLAAGEINSLLTIEIRESSTTPSLSSAAGDFTINDYGDFRALWWEKVIGASEYAIERSDTPQGAFTEMARVPLTSAVDSSASADACYQVMAVNASGIVMRQYGPVCIQSGSQGAQNNPSVQSGAVSSQPPYNRMCLSDSELTDSSSMTLSEIEDFLSARDSFLRGDFRDVDGTVINVARALFEASQASGISAKVLLTTLEKESTGVSLRPRPSTIRLRYIMGYDPEDLVLLPAEKSVREQIHDSAAQFRRDYDRLSQPPYQTLTGWQVGMPKASNDPLTVTPTTKTVATLFGYTEWVGERWGGRQNIGGNSSFCYIWRKFQFETVPSDFWTPTTGPDLNNTVFTGALVATPPGELWASTNRGCFDHIALGVLRSTDRGLNWSPVNFGFFSTNVRTLMLTPSGELFAGVHDGVYRFDRALGAWNPSGLGGVDVNVLRATTRGLWASDSCFCTGVRQSTDDGQTWQRFDAGLPLCVNAIVQHPATGDLYAGTGTSGVYRLPVGAVSWSPVSEGLGSSDLHSLAVNGSGDLFAGTIQGLFRRPNGAPQWTALTQGLPSDGIQSIAIKSQGKMLIGTFSHGVYFSSDNGDTWTETNAGIPDVSRAVGAIAFDSQGFAYVSVGSIVYRSVVPVE